MKIKSQIDKQEHIGRSARGRDAVGIKFHCHSRLPSAHRAVVFVSRVHAGRWLKQVQRAAQRGLRGTGQATGSQRARHPHAHGLHCPHGLVVERPLAPAVGDHFHLLVNGAAVGPRVKRHVAVVVHGF